MCFCWLHCCTSGEETETVVYFHSNLDCLLYTTPSLPVQTQTSETVLAESWWSQNDTIFSCVETAGQPSAHILWLVLNKFFRSFLTLLVQRGQLLKKLASCQVLWKMSIYWASWRDVNDWLMMLEFLTLVCRGCLFHLPPEKLQLPKLLIMLLL